MTNCATAQEAVDRVAVARASREALSRAATTIATIPTAIPEANTAGSTRPTIVPARVRDGRTANAAGATTAVTSNAAPSQAASRITVARTRGDGVIGCRLAQIRRGTGCS